MPEYLSPGVYVEEIEIGAKPIEGVSTSTAGFVGMTERGPLNKPTLVTSFAEYQRTFGGYLGSGFVKGKEDYRFLPLAVEGFFSNGGQRAYITRVAADPNSEKSNHAQTASGFLPSTLGADTQLSSDAEAGYMSLNIESTAGLEKGDELALKDGHHTEFFKLSAIAELLHLDSDLTEDLAEGSTITRMTKGSKIYTIKNNPKESEKSIELENIDSSLAITTILFVNDSSNPEICTIAGIPAPSDPSLTTIKLVNGLKHDHLAGTIILTLTDLPKDNIKILAAAGPNDPIIVDRTVSIAQNDAIKISNSYFIVEAIEPRNLILISKKLEYSHKAKAAIKKLIPAINVYAANEGEWGNRIKIEVQISSILSTKLSNDASIGQNYLELETVVGIETGTSLMLPGGPYVVSKVINSGNPQVILDDDQKISSELKKGDPVETDEFDLIVHFDNYDETYRYLSKDKRHSRYFINMLASSAFITPGADKIPSNAVLLPTEEYPDGWKLIGGQNGIPADASDADAIYEGTDDLEPTKRTGLYTLKNIDGISIVAIPGLSSKDHKALQSKVINHCETMGDRFAVLDSRKTADLNDIQDQRNQFDSKYAALYYPWISIFDPLSKQQIDAPPSGHVCGIYARSDTERGVHKAPANEVVRGALDLEMSKTEGLRTLITKGQQDVLNPKGINCIRAFPGRGIRVWGARTISSDPLWRYVNVRRLFLYVEKSINDGTQWVVFEPNDEKLWARMKQTINQFLTTVWRSGALMGATQDEAFFVKCDRSTMTQADIDNGKLIVLIGIAPVKPAEFVIFRIAQVAKGSSISG
jgi:hypothetical protein